MKKNSDAKTYMQSWRHAQVGYGTGLCGLGPDLDIDLQDSLLGMVYYLPSDGSVPINAPRYRNGNMKLADIY